MDWTTALRKMDACAPAVKWARQYPDAKSALESCERPDWMFWLARERGVDRRIIVRAACACARTALQFVQAGEDRPRLALEAAERWTRGEATIEEVRAARRAAYADAAAGAAADAAAYAAYADAAADAAAYAAAYAAYAAADAAAARLRALRLGADVLRRAILITEAA